MPRFERRGSQARRDQPRRYGGGKMFSSHRPRGDGGAPSARARPVNVDRQDGRFYRLARRVQNRVIGSSGSLASVPTDRARWLRHSNTEPRRCFKRSGSEGGSISRRCSWRSKPVCQTTRSRGDRRHQYGCLAADIASSAFLQADRRAPYYRQPLRILLVRAEIRDAVMPAGVRVQFRSGRSSDSSMSRGEHPLQAAMRCRRAPPVRRSPAA